MKKRREGGNPKRKWRWRKKEERSERVERDEIKEGMREM